LSFAPKAGALEFELRNDSRVPSAFNENSDEIVIELVMTSNHTQPGVLLDLPKVARYLTFVVRDANEARSALQTLRNRVDGLTCVVGLGEALIEGLDANIPGLKYFPSLVGAGVEVPSTPGALWCWLRGDDRGELLHWSRRIAADLAPAFELAHAIDAFKYDDGRDLTGYEDGTENPEGQAAIDTAIVVGGRGLEGSSFVAVQQWQHDLDRFDALSSRTQDESVGRRRTDNEELADAPESAHVKRTAQESFSPEAFVWRRSMPWSDSRTQGLVFVAFGHSFDAFEAQMRRMVGLDDGIADALFRFTRPVTGNYYWCPPLREGRLDLSAIGL
jgi:putative iron-dependent peroxidase